jgi:hypothetical protein
MPAIILKYGQMAINGNAVMTGFSLESLRRGAAAAANGGRDIVGFCVCVGCKLGGGGTCTNMTR